MVEETDFVVYDAKDWEVSVGNHTVELLAGFEATPQFSDEAGLIETLQGEVGFNLSRASTKGTCRIRMKMNSKSKNVLFDFAKNRTIVAVSALNVAANKSRYPMLSMGLTHALIRPAATPLEKQSPDIEFEAIGFGYSEIPT